MIAPSAIEILRSLVRFDTTNPLGNEAAWVSYIATLIADACIPSICFALDDARPNLIARLAGSGEAPPLLLASVTDGRFFIWLGIQTYGFTPMRLPADFNFTATIHAADERISIDAPEFGASAIYQAIQRYRV